MMLDTQTPARIFEISAFRSRYSGQALETGKQMGRAADEIPLY
jgi:hypothetical protein